MSGAIDQTSQRPQAERSTAPISDAAGPRGHHRCVLRLSSLACVERATGCLAPVFTGSMGSGTIADRFRGDLTAAARADRGAGRRRPRCAARRAERGVLDGPVEPGDHRGLGVRHGRALGGRPSRQVDGPHPGRRISRGPRRSSLFDLDGEAVLELGCAVRDALAGRGYATEIGRAAFAWAAEHRPGIPIVAFTRCTTTCREQSCGVSKCSPSARYGAKASSRASSASTRTRGSRSIGFEAPASEVILHRLGPQAPWRSTGAPQADGGSGDGGDLGS